MVPAVWSYLFNIVTRMRMYKDRPWVNLRSYLSISEIKISGWYRLNTINDDFTRSLCGRQKRFCLKNAYLFEVMQVSHRTTWNRKNSVSYKWKPRLCGNMSRNNRLLGVEWGHIQRPRQITFPKSYFMMISNSNKRIKKRPENGQPDHRDEN